MTDIPTDPPLEDSKAAAEERGRRNINRTIVLIIAVFAVIGWFINLYFAAIYDWEGVPGGKGEFGDIFGVINSLFTGLAFIGVVWSVHTQREELRETRKIAKIAHDELKNTQRILDKQEENIGKQNAATTKQIFEATFFQLFSQFNANVNNFSTVRTVLDMEKTTNDQLHYKKIVVTGRDAFAVWIEEVQNKYSSILNSYQGYIKDANELSRKWNEDNPRKCSLHYDVGEDVLMLMRMSESELRERALQNAFSEVCGVNREDLGQYYRTLYTLMKFIKESEIADEDQPFYFQFIRAQMGHSESAMLMFNCIFYEGSKKLHALVREYGMLKDIELHSFLIHQFLTLVHPRCFGKSHYEIVSRTTDIEENSYRV